MLPLSGLLAAQQSQPKPEAVQNSGIVLRRTVRRVPVDVVVTDGQGHQVTGLKASDFHITEDGKPQEIRQFHWASEESAQSDSLPRRPPLPPHTFMNLAEAPERGPLTVLLYDVLNTPTAAQPFMRSQMLEFLKKSAGRRIAIFVLGDRLRILQGFTSDTDLLAGALNRSGGPSLMGYRSELIGLPANPPVPPASTSRPSETQQWEMRSGEMTQNATQSYNTELVETRIDLTLESLIQIERFLVGLPGRKNLIWYSGSFPAGIMPDPNKSPTSLRLGSVVRDDSVRNYTERIKKATDLLSAAQVAVYPVDARGLLADVDTHLEQRAARFASMDLIAEQTGGRAFHETNGLSSALQTAAADGGSYYSLVYAPSNTKFDGSLRHISVRLDQGHYHLAYRRSYFADDRASDQQPEGATAERLASADSMETSSDFGAPLSRQLIFAAHAETLGSPAPATAEQMAALAPYQEKAAKAQHKTFLPPATPLSMQQYAIEYGVLAQQLDLPAAANGIYHSDVSIAILAFDDEGTTLWGTKTELKDDIPASMIDSIRKKGLRAIQTLSVPIQTSVLRLVIRDEHSKRTGSLEIRLPLQPAQEQSASKQ